MNLSRIPGVNLSAEKVVVKIARIDPDISFACMKFAEARAAFEISMLLLLIVRRTINPSILALSLV